MGYLTSGYRPERGAKWSGTGNLGLRENVLMLTANELIQILDLRPLPFEGGFYRETYRSKERWPFAGSAPAKSLATAIYYLVTPESFSALHRLPTDEIFHCYLGGPVNQLLLFPDGQGQVRTLGPDLAAGHQLQAVVPAGVWQGSFLPSGIPYALLGTTMAPGFDPGDYEPGRRADLERQYPAFAEWIARLTPDACF